ncbi:MAG TPA: hypothetical protein VJX67_26570 [Blastocatellia bacterium]|nr:hypothetical protein [Blastocatellia bacterium]
MIFPKYIKIGLAFLTLILLQAPSHGENPTPRAHQGPQDVPLPWILQDIGKRCGCYFTVENAYSYVGGRAIRGEWSREAIIEEVRVPTSIRDQSLPEAMKALKSLVPHLTYKIDQKDSRIVHIRDDRLRQEPDYLLDRPVTAFEFKGTRAELVEALAAQGFSVYNSPHSFRSPEPDNLITMVRVGAEPVTVRAVLSSFIPSDAESRVLWESYSLLHSYGSAYIYYP